VWFIGIGARWEAICGCTLPGSKLESAQRTSSPSASILIPDPARNPTNRHNQEAGREAVEKTKDWGGGASAHRERGEWTATKKARASPPTSSTADGRPPARWFGGLSLARPLALEFNSTDLHYFDLITTLWYPTHVLINLIQMEYMCI
jgi:hypothetical protein